VAGQAVDDLGGVLAGLLVGGDGLAGDVQALEQGDGPADLVGLFDLIGAVYGEAGDFFWV
jgi:hypothetical protein